MQFTSLFTTLAGIALAVAADPSYFPLDAALNTPFILDLVDKNIRNISSEAMHITSRITTTVVAWRDVPGPVHPRAGPHSGDSATIRADVRVHIKTPSWCSDVDGSITYYLWPVWDGSRVQLRPDGWDTHTDLGSACEGPANDRLKQQVGKAETIKAIKDLMDYVFGPWTAKQRWISATKGTLAIDRELPGVLPPLGPGCPAPKPPPQCPPPRPVNKPPVVCELQTKNDGCGTKVCVCKPLDE